MFHHFHLQTHSSKWTDVTHFLSWFVIGLKMFMTSLNFFSGYHIMYKIAAI